MVDVLWRDGQRTAALRLEELWNDLQTRHSFALLCAYAIGNFYKEPAELEQVCAIHTHVFGAQGAGDSAALTYTGLPPDYARQLAHEIAHREEVEHALRASVRDLRYKEDELRRNQEQLSDFVENAPVGMHRVGPDGRVLWDFDSAKDYTTANGVRASGGSIDVGGPAIANGVVATTSGYGQWGGMRGNVLLVFSVDGK